MRSTASCDEPTCDSRKASVPRYVASALAGLCYGGQKGFKFIGDQRAHRRVNLTIAIRVGQKLKQTGRCLSTDVICKINQLLIPLAVVDQQTVSAPGETAIGVSDPVRRVVASGRVSNLLSKSIESRVGAMECVVGSIEAHQAASSVGARFRAERPSEVTRTPPMLPAVGTSSARPAAIQASTVAWSM